MGIQKAVVFERVSWDERAAAKIAPLVHDNVKSEFEADINSGRCVLWLVDGETYLVTRVEKLKNKKIQLVLDCIAGKNAKGIVSALIERVKKMGVSSIRFETHHQERTAEKLVNGLGFERIATVFVAEI